MHSYTLLGYRVQVLPDLGARDELRFPQIGDATGAFDGRPAWQVGLTALAFAKRYGLPRSEIRGRKRTMTSIPLRMKGARMMGTLRFLLPRTSTRSIFSASFLSKGDRVAAMSLFAAPRPLFPYVSSSIRADSPPLLLLKTMTEAAIYRR